MYDCVHVELYHLQMPLMEETYSQGTTLILQYLISKFSYGIGKIKSSGDLRQRVADISLIFPFNIQPEAFVPC